VVIFACEHFGAPVACLRPAPRLKVRLEAALWGSTSGEDIWCVARLLPAHRDRFAYLG
jgi:hypothetical protein